MGISPELPDLEVHRAELLGLAGWLVPRRLQPRLDPEDLVQKTFEDVLRHPDRLAGKSAADVLWYLRNALRNNAIDELRRCDPFADVSPEEFVNSSVQLAELVPADQSSPSQRAEQAELLARLAGAVAELPDAQRVAVEMRYLRGLRGAEMARLLNRSEGAVGLLLNRALKTLHNTLDDSDSRSEGRS
jgi:RNA polymerase sigma-70 factor (ECF subfamily)